MDKSFFDRGEDGNNLITRKSPRIITLFTSLDQMLEKLEVMSKEYRPMLNGERYLTDKELSERLKLNRRTLLEYRNEGRISYYQVGGKILYRESDVEKMLNQNYRKAYK